MSIENQSLPIPDEVLLEEETEVAELARVWWCRNRPQMTIRPAARDPRLIGLILAELAWNYSNAYERAVGMDPEKAFSDILAGWQDGLEMVAETKARAAK
ncbi:MAG: DUF5076 domain-containing protein [Brevundimonas sp.]|jgi:hypothetical protein|uniref:DUF5076 domain-containing protein n=1 Tax=Brevundimonas sp. TaxID=1871086 RepID=UPI0017F3E65E|nr:DUF5076 domain-containing protein [Brevundimonas sp.]MBA4803202.1 DUF5076 domain-containing protein [Brevundimonas sp.]